MRVIAIDRPGVPPCDMPARFRTEIAYFMTPFGNPGVPPLAPGEYWVRASDAQQWLNDLVFEIVSPLDAASKAQIELTDDQEAWLEWMVRHHVERVRLEESPAPLPRP